MNDRPDAPVRPVPRVTALTEPFWRGGARGELRIQRCADPGCGYYVHPPAPVCPRCHGRALDHPPVSGRARVVASTVNHQAWLPGWDLPYSVAIVELAEQPGLRLTTNVVDCDPHAVHVGMPVRVRFTPIDDDVWLPRFAPTGEDPG